MIDAYATLELFLVRFTLFPMAPLFCQEVPQDHKNGHQTRKSCLLNSGVLLFLR